MRERILIVKVNARVRRVPKAVHVVVPVNHHDHTNLEQGCHRDWPVVPCDNKRCIGVGNGGGVCWWCMLVVCGGGGGVWRGSYLRPILRPASSCPDSPQGSGVSGPPTWLSTSPSQNVSIRPAYDACILRKHLQFVPRNFGAIR